MKPSVIPAPEPFHWRTVEGIVITPPAMTTTHLFHAARMVWNHTVEDPLRLMPYREWPAVYDWTADARRDAMEAFLTELAGRKDATPEHAVEIAHIRRHMAAFEEVLVAIEQDERESWDAEMDTFGDFDLDHCQ